MPWIIIVDQDIVSQCLPASMRPRRYAVDNLVKAVNRPHRLRVASMRPRRYAVDNSDSKQNETRAKKLQ